MKKDGLVEATEKLMADEALAILQRIGPHLPALTRLSVSLLRNRADAEDVVQETVLRSFQRIHQLREGQCIKGWLMQIAVNEARMRMRTRRRFWDATETGAGAAADGDGEGAHTSFLHEIQDTRDTPHTLVERAQQRRAIRRALARLQLRYREVFVLRDMVGIGGAHASSILGISETALHTRLNRARRQMRKMLAPFTPAAQNGARSR